MGFAGTTSVEIAREANLRTMQTESDQKLAKTENQNKDAGTQDNQARPQPAKVEITAERYLRPSVSRRS